MGNTGNLLTGVRLLPASALSAAALLIAGCDADGTTRTEPMSKPTTTVSAPPAEYLVSPGRVGQLRVGMTAQQAAARGLARRFVECGQLRYGVLNNREDMTYLYGYFAWDDPHDLERIDISRDPSHRFRTAAGIGIGSTLADLRRAYGSRLTKLPQADPDFEPTRFALSKEQGAIVFELDPDRNQHTVAPPRNVPAGQPLTADTEIARMSVDDQDPTQDPAEDPC